MYRFPIMYQKNNVYDIKINLLTSNVQISYNVPKNNVYDIKINLLTSNVQISYNVPKKQCL